MNETKPQCVPFLQVKNAQKSCAFYCDLLGFQKDWEYQPESSLPCFISISRDGIQLFLTEHPESAFGVLVYCYVEDVDHLYQSLVAQGVELEWIPADTPWQTREMQLQDLDGNKLRFGSELKQQQE